jgi:DNA-binding CsgD family transcriptional regulator
LAGGNEGKKRNRRSYRPTVEAMEALRLLSSASATAALPGLTAEHNLLADPHPTAIPRLDDFPSVSTATWDAALVQTQLDQILATAPSVSTSPSNSTSTTPSDPTALASGLSQLDKYLSRAWYRAGIPAQMHEDSTQAVFTTLLQQLGRDRFDALVSDVGHSGIKDVFSRETNEGVDFFRAVDMVKKRAQRERVFQPLDAVDVSSASASSSGSETALWHEALREAIDRSLSPREASLINETLMGKTPAEIALHWGVAPKTISNEKTRVLQKLRDVLLAQNDA